MKNIPCLLAVISSRRMRIKSSSAQSWQRKTAWKLAMYSPLTHAGFGQQEGESIDTIPEKTAFAEVEIVGVFQCDGAADSVDSPTAGKAANHIYSDSHLLVNLQEQQEGIFEGEIAFYIADPLELDTLLERVEAIDSIDWDNHILRENDFQYEQIAGQLQNLQNLAVALIAIASVLSIANSHTDSDDGDTRGVSMKRGFTSRWEKPKRKSLGSLP